MAGGFNNPLVGDGGGLVYPSIHSPNFVHGVSGWSINKDGSAEFRSIVVAPGTSITVFIQGPTPTANAIGDLWYDSTNGMLLHQWDGATWGPFSIGTGAIASGAITAALIAANTITAAQIAAGTITATQIAANTITAAKIAANTISAAQLSAGIVYAGIVDGTTISGAQFIAHGSTGEILVYSGTPATGNLIMSVSATATTDGILGNVVDAGITSYDNTLGVKANLFAGVLSFNTIAGASTLKSNISDEGGNGLWQGSLFNISDQGTSIGLNSKHNSGDGTNPEVVLNDRLLTAQVNHHDPASIHIPEAYHPFTLVGGTSAGTDVNGTAYPPSYKMLPDGDLALTGVVHTAAGGLAATTTWAVIPASYRPATNIPVALIANAISGTLTHVFVRPNGNMQFLDAIGGASNMWIDCTLHINGV